MKKTLGLILFLCSTVAAAKPLGAIDQAIYNKVVDMCAPNGEKAFTEIKTWDDIGRARREALRFNFGSYYGETYWDGLQEALQIDIHLLTMNSSALDREFSEPILSHQLHAILKSPGLAPALERCFGNSKLNKEMFLLELRAVDLAARVSVATGSVAGFSLAIRRVFGAGLTKLAPKAMKFLEMKVSPMVKKVGLAALVTVTAPASAKFDRQKEADIQAAMRLDESAIDDLPVRLDMYQQALGNHDSERVQKASKLVQDKVQLLICDDRGPRETERLKELIRLSFQKRAITYVEPNCDEPWTSVGTSTPNSTQKTISGLR